LGALAAGLPGPEVDSKALRATLLAASPPRAVIYGHLLSEVVRKGEAEAVAVLRCEPMVLKARLAKRGYPAAKVRQNVEAELIGVVLDDCVSRFGKDKVREYDTTSGDGNMVARSIARDVRSRREPPARWTDWTLDYDSPTKLTSLLSAARAAPGST